jgi:hypothetical protein
VATLPIFRNRTNRIKVNVGYDISADTLVSEIREEKTHTSTLIATLDIDYRTDTVEDPGDGTDGKLLLTLDDSDVPLLPPKYAYMDIKRISGGEPLTVMKRPIRVRFQEVITE